MSACQRLQQQPNPPTDILQREFPELHSLYCAVMDAVKAKHPEVEALFYPFASFAINAGGKVVTCGHIDRANFGLCVLIPFGDFNPQEARLVLEELGFEIEVAPGVPIFFPSALYYHYNTALESAGVRNSFVAWMGGSLVQWYKLGGTAVRDLCADCSKHYKSAAGKAERVSLWMDMFPRETGI